MKTRTITKIEENKDSKNKENNENKGNKDLKNTEKSTSVTPTPKKKSSSAKWIWIMFFVFLFMILMMMIFSGPKVVTFNPYFDGTEWQGVDIFRDDKLFHPDNWKNVKVEFYDYSPSGGNIIALIDNGLKGKDHIIFEASFSSATGLSGFNAFIDFLVRTYEFDNTKNLIELSTSPGLLYILIVGILPWVLIIGGSYWLMKKMMTQQGNIGNMSKKSMAPQISNIKFANVAGYEEIKAELWEIVDFLKNPDKYSKVGARTPKGVMLSGPPGTGKTFLAKAVAGEAAIPFFSISGSDFVEMFVGVGAKRVRELFAQAKSVAPALIFIDELDAVGRQRGAGVGGGNDEREQTLNQMLVELDGFTANSGVIVMAATNRPDVLDPALKRPGRFDRSIEFRMPDIVERESILKIYSKVGEKVFSKDIDWENIAGRTPGFSPAELENVINEAAILSVRLKKKEITLDILDEAIDRVIGGPSKSNNLMSDEEKKLIAYHESGHALIGLALSDAEKVQKITIVPRGSAGGYVLMTPKKEKFVQTKSELEAKIVSYMAGRASEEFFFGKNEITTGAYSDIQEATKIARRMVTEFGMSNLGPIQYEKPEGSIFLGRGDSSSKNYSGQIANDIDKEVRLLIDGAYKKAYKLISNNKKLMDLLASALLIKETLNAEEAEYIYVNKKLPEKILDMQTKQKKKKETAINRPSSEKKKTTTSDKTKSTNDKPKPSPEEKKDKPKSEEKNKK